MMTDDRYIADARERLRKKAQNEATCFALNDMLKDAQDEVRRLREENERLRKDAERYRWLRDSEDELSPRILRMVRDADPDLDDAIDAARGGK